MSLHPSAASVVAQDKARRHRRRRRMFIATGVVAGLLLFGFFGLPPIIRAQAVKHLSAAPQPTKVKAMIASEGLPAVRLHTQGEDCLPQTHCLRRGDP